MPPLNWIRAFEAAGRHLSFTLAAQELNVTQAAVSQQVRVLERRLGIALFRRVHNRLFLTYAGQAWLPKVTAGFGLIESGMERLPLQRNDETLTVRAPSSFSIQWLAPRLDRFRNRCPAIDIRLSALGRKLDTEGGRIDIEIRNGSGVWVDAKSILLMHEEVFPVCNPELLVGPAGIRKVRDIAGHALLHVSGYREDWEWWFTAAGLGDIRISPGLYFDQSVTAIQAAVNGFGVALGRSALVAGEQATGRLVAPFALRLRAEDAYWITYPEDSAGNPNIAAFRDWLLEEAADPAAIPSY